MSNEPRNRREQPQRYRMEAAECSNCSTVSFPPRLVCEFCGERDFNEYDLPESGTVKTYTVIRVPPDKFDEEAPYVIGIIELEGDLRITSQITGCDIEDVEIGMEVKAEFRRIQEDGEAGMLRYGYKFVPK